MKKSQRTTVASLMSLVPMLFTIGCGMPPAETDGKMNSSKQAMTNSIDSSHLTKVYKAQKMVAMEGLRQAPKAKMRLMQPPSKSKQPSLVEPAPKMSLRPESKQKCGSLRAVPRKVLAQKQVESRQPDAEELKDLKKKFQLVWDVMQQEPGLPLYIYLNINNQDVRFIEQGGQGLQAIERIGENNFRLEYEAHEAPGDYRKSVFFKYQKNTYKLSICYSVQ